MIRSTRWAVAVSAIVVAAGTLLLPVPLAHADGMILAPSNILRYFAEQSQVGVVEVKADRTVAVDLYISLLDTSGQSHEVSFLLPLQAMPKGFRAQETTLARFTEARLQPLGGVLRAAEHDRRQQQEAIARAYAASSLVAGPLAFAARNAALPEPLQWATKGMSAGAAEKGPVPTISVRTEHSRLEVYASLQPDQLAALAQLSALPPKTRQALTSYVGRPFALVCLRTVPRAESAVEVDAGGHPRPSYVPPEQQPGVVFSFDQAMIKDADGSAHRYDFPLGTGQAWEHPIPTTQVYITGDEALNFTVDFPGRPRAQGSLLSKGDHEFSSSQAGAADGRQVHVATYLESNPKQDIGIVLNSGGRSELVLEMQEMRGRALLSRVAFPALALAAWALAFWLVVWRGSARQLGFWAALGGSWAIAQGLLLMPLLLLTAAWDSFPFWRYWRYRIDDLWIWALTSNPERATTIFLTVAWMIFAIIWLLIIRGMLKYVPERARPLFWRAPLAAVIAAAIYLSAAAALLSWLAPGAQGRLPSG